MKLEYRRRHIEQARSQPVKERQQIFQPADFRSTSGMAGFYCRENTPRIDRARPIHNVAAE